MTFNKVFLFIIKHFSIVSLLENEEIFRFKTTQTNIWIADIIIVYLMILWQQTFCSKDLQMYLEKHVHKIDFVKSLASNS